MIGQPLVIFADTTVCDRCGVDGDLFTDGHIAYAVTGVWPNQPTSGSQSDLIHRDGTVIEVTCTAPSRERFSDDPCGGYLRFNLADDGGWRKATPDRLSLLSYGGVIER